MENKRCFFIGAKKIKKRKEKAIKEKLNGIIGGLVAEGIKEFYSLADAGFEILAAKCVAEMKATNKNPVLYIKLPIIKKRVDTDYLEDIRTVCAVANVVSPCENMEIGPQLHWLYALYVSVSDVIVVYKEKIWTRKNKMIGNILERYAREKAKIIYIN